MKKINIYYKGEYICSSMGYKTCKEYKQIFSNSLYVPMFSELERQYKPQYINDLKSLTIDKTRIIASYK